MLLIAGLGNPGRRYEKHRHNVGFMAVEAIHRHENFGPWKVKFRGLVAEGTLGGTKALLIKPTTYMNNSGVAIGEAARFYKIDPRDVVVMYDELDLPPGKVRVKTGGGAGGHNGIRSIDSHFGKNYRRVRIGIGHPGQKDRVSGHVLGDFAKRDHDWLEPLLAEIARNAELLANGEDATFMNRIALGTASDEPVGAKGSPKPKPKGKSHIRQANKPAPSAPKTGPMAGMLKKLFGDD